MSFDPVPTPRPSSGENEPVPETALAADLQAIAQRRDRAALARLFAFYAPRIKAHLLRAGNVDGIAEDVTQEVMLAIWQRAHQFDPLKVAPSTWVFAIVRDVRASRGRRAPPSSEKAQSSLPMADVDVPPRSGGVSEVEAMRQALLETIERLPKEQAELVRVFYFADEPQQGTVAARRLRRVLAKLRTMVDGTR